MQKFNTRGFASLLLSLTFLVVFISGLVLWLAHSPQTFGIGKGVWKHSHIFVSLLMVAAAILHFALNWPAYCGYLRHRMSGGLHCKRELALALVLTIAVVAVASFDNNDGMMQQLGTMNPQQIAKMSGKSVDQVVAVLKKEGIDVHNPADTLREIADHNKISPQAVCAIVQRQLPAPPMRPDPS